MYRVKPSILNFRMQRAHPEEYNFIPQTWVLPAEYPLQSFCETLVNHNL